MRDVIGVVGVIVVLGTAMLFLRGLHKRSQLHPELSRKAIHVLMGLVCLTFPWVFDSPVPVWVLALLAAGALAATRTIPALKQNFGSVLCGVERQSFGELLFPLSVAFVFTLSRGNALLYCVPILIMTLADATAALIGQRYGFARYETVDGWRSVEGSFAFLAVAFLSTHVPLLLFTHVGRAESLLIALVMAHIVMLLEAISWRGLDNLFVPVVAYVCLVRMIGADAHALISRAVVLLALVAAWTFWRTKTRLTQAAAIGAALVLYVVWAFGDGNWLIAPLATTATYIWLCRLPVSEPRSHSVHAIASLGGVAICWLALAQIVGTVNTIYAYGIGFAAHLGMIALARFADGAVENAWPVAVIKAFAVGFLPLAIPYCFVWRGNTHVIALTVSAAALVLAAIVVFACAQPGLRNCPSDGARWIRQGLIAGAVSAIGFIVISKLEPWSKSFL
jgi:phytol kinase